MDKVSEVMKSFGWEELVVRKYFCPFCEKIESIDLDEKEREIIREHYNVSGWVPTIYYKTSHGDCMVRVGLDKWLKPQGVYNDSVNNSHVFYVNGKYDKAYLQKLVGVVNESETESIG